jgi:GNAT superfamily N-acetyltransferase
MTWRVSTAEFKANSGAGNRAAMRALVDGGKQPGVLLYENGHAVAWCAVAPRDEYIRLAASRILAPVDDEKVWSVSCFFVDKKARGKGLTVAVLCAAVEFARMNGARIVEGYPQELEAKLPPAFVWTGVMPTFVHAGFSEAARRSAKRPIMRMNTGRAGDAKRKSGATGEKKRAVQDKKSSGATR